MKRKLVFSVVSGALLFAGAVLADTKDPDIEGYFRVEQALVNDDLNVAKTAATDLAQKAQAANNGMISKEAADLANAGSIEQARQAFKTLSEDTLNLIQGGEGSQDTACSMRDAQCIQTPKSAQSSCMGSGRSNCAMMRLTCSGGCS